MISFSNLGNFGHLGNQMFQYAAIRGIAANRGFDWCIPSKDNFGKTYNVRSTLYECFELYGARVSDFIAPVQYAEQSYAFNESLYSNCLDNSDLSGYFQSYKYFENIQDEIKNDFTFKKNIVLENPYATIHVRRTDYLASSNSLINLSLDYYKEAIEMLPDVQFLVMSDDIDWCREQDVFKNCSFSYYSAYEDLSIMTKAIANITANSSFSWWGAWLNQNLGKIVIAPNKWFGPALPDHNTKDLIPSDWIVI